MGTIYFGNFITKIPSYPREEMIGLQSFISLSLHLTLASEFENTDNLKS